MRHIVALRGSIRPATLQGVPRPRSLALVLATLASAASVAGCPATGEGPGPVDADGGLPAESCDVVAPTACTDPDLSYADVEPIIARRCLGCHDGSGPEWALTDYRHVADWFSDIRSMMLSCSMPPPDSGMTMPVEERETILHWIRCDYPR